MSWKAIYLPPQMTRRLKRVRHSKKKALPAGAQPVGRNGDEASQRGQEVRAQLCAAASVAAAVGDLHDPSRAADDHRSQGKIVTAGCREVGDYRPIRLRASPQSGHVQDRPRTGDLKTLRGNCTEV